MQELREALLFDISLYINDLKLPFVQIETSQEVVFVRYKSKVLEKLIPLNKREEKFDSLLEKEKKGGFVQSSLGLFYKILRIEELGITVTLGGFRTREGEVMEQRLPTVLLEQLYQIPVQELDEIRKLLLGIKGRIIEVIQTSEKFVCYKLLQIIHKNPSKRHTLSVLSEELFTSRKKLGDILKKHTGKSFSRYLTDWRMNRANLLLDEDILSVEEIARQTGYGERTSFTRAYKNYFGYPPSRRRGS